jgi:hypothetical protein
MAHHSFLLLTLTLLMLMMMTSMSSLFTPVSAGYSYGGGGGGGGGGMGKQQQWKKCCNAAPKSSHAAACFGTFDETNSAAFLADIKQACRQFIPKKGDVEKKSTAICNKLKNKNCIS